jgi:hypothetical protein
VNVRPVTRRAVTAALLVPTLMSACGGSDAKPQASRSASPRAQDSTRKLVVHRLGTLPAPIQLPAAVPLPDGRVLSLGGLSAADTSTDSVTLIDPSGRATVVGHLPQSLHDSAAAGIGGRAYLFGGGDLASSPAILRVAASGQTSSAGRLPVGASDVSAATVGATAYVVGGYTGSVPLRSILAFTPGRGVRQAGSMPRPLRYAAVAAVGPAVLIAGGTSGTAAQRSVLRFDPRTRRVTQVARLPQPLTHAAAASLGGRLYVIGGRGPAVNSASAAIWAVDPSTGRVRAAGRLPVALSDLGAAATASGIVLIGGRDRAGRVRDSVLSARAAP